MAPNRRSELRCIEHEPVPGELRVDILRQGAPVELHSRSHLRCSSGGTEGAVNRIKKIKRHLYGRAEFDLLRKMILLA
ncbi:hypothetical protein OG800_23710 [Streptomyces sp. NBC_00445]|uniref:hypothetical protein n=1 Tax=Streptomyces sp. NBC_00445 TaxID=2975745 RepID=UPI002E1DB4FF